MNCRLDELPPKLCVRLAGLEICEWLIFMLVMGSSRGQHTIGRQFVQIWLLAVLAAANVLRTSTMILGHYTPMILRSPLLWLRPMLNVHVLIISGAMQCGACISIYIALHRWFGEDPGCPVPSFLCGERGQLFPELLVVLNWTASILFGNCSDSYWRGLSRESPPKAPAVAFVLHDASAECGGSTCAICLEDFSSDCLLGRLPCGHVYHRKCVRKWLRTVRSQNWCPMRCPSTASVSREVCSSTIGQATAPQLQESPSTSQASRSGLDIDVSV